MEDSKEREAFEAWREKCGYNTETFQSVLWLAWQARATIAAPAPASSAALSEALAQIGAILGPGENSLSTLLACIRNIKHFADCLDAVEREFFMVPGEPSDDPEDEGFEPSDECLLNRWGSTVEQYVERFRAAIPHLLAAQPAAPAHYDVKNEVGLSLRDYDQIEAQASVMAAEDARASRQCTRCEYIGRCDCEPKSADTRQGAALSDEQTRAQLEALARHSYGGRFAVYMSGDDARAILSRASSSRAEVEQADLFKDMLQSLEHVESVYCLNVVKDSGEPSSTLDNLQRVIARAKAATPHSEVEQDVPECNGSHDYSTIEAGIEKECTVCTGEDAQTDSTPLVRFVTYLSENCIGQVVTEDALEEWALDVLESTPREVTSRSGPRWLVASAHQQSAAPAESRAEVQAKILLPMPELIDRTGCVLELRFEEESQAVEFENGLELPAPAGKAFPANVEFVAAEAQAEGKGE